MIGSGNVATHLGPELLKAGHSIVQCFSRSMSGAADMAAKLDSKAIDDFSMLDRQADLYLIMVSDDAIAEVVEQLPTIAGIVAHTSGAMGLEVLSIVSQNTGVLWIPQTFSKERVPDLSNAPFCVEASNEASLRLLIGLAGQISDDVREVNTQERRAAHLAAVIGANFSNYMYTLAAKVLDKEGMDLSIIAPLLKETLNKALDIGPEAGQTGPARRGDRKIIAEHVQQMVDDPELKTVYEELSSAIIRHYGEQEF
jgi:predicted short-subunit dehydrogenase-like oxidoreductase (DUF2520 family)